MPHRFTNWSGSLSFTAGAYEQPKNEAELSTLIATAAAAGRNVRPVGTGHSSVPLMATDHHLVSLADWTGVAEADVERGCATVLPGTGLADLGEQLWQAELGMENLGDVDYQSIVGAVGTGTHGTGAELPNLSATVVGGTLIAGTGELLRFGVGSGDRSEGSDPGFGPEELRRAAQLSLGSLGVMTSLTLRVRSAYRLHRQNWMTHIDWVMEHFDELAARYRHVDFYWYPRSDRAQVRILDEPDRQRDLLPPGELKAEDVGRSYEVIPNDRHLKFDEMEYMLPRETGLAAFARARRRIKERHRADVGWRVLVRTIAGDDGMLSNAPGSTMTIALLQNAGLDHAPYFSDMEPLFLDFGGRPHWGKKHSMTAEELRQMYPEWDRFQEIRRRLDPKGVFMNDYLRRLFDPEHPNATAPNATGGWGT